MNSKADTPKRARFKPITAFLILLVHVGALAAVLPYFFSWTGLILFGVLSWLSASLGVSLAYHRMLSHKAWRGKPWLRNFLTWCACLSLEMGPIAWSATHRLHHRESDHEDDPHSPLRSIIWSHIGWMLYDHPIIDDKPQRDKLVPDLLKDPAMRFFEKTYWVHWVVIALLSMGVGYLVGGLQFALSLFVWGSLVRTVAVWHCTWFVNSVTHLFGYRNYETTDDSRNLWWVSVVTYGEGWHNNHHAVAGCAKFGHRWFEFDPTYWALWVFNKFGWVEKINLNIPEREDGVLPVTGQLVAKSKALKSLMKPRKPAGSQAR